MAAARSKTVCRPPFVEMCAPMRSPLARGKRNRFRGMQSRERNALAHPYHPNGLNLVPVLSWCKYKRTKTDMAHSALHSLRCSSRIDCDETIDSKRDKPEEHEPNAPSTSKTAQSYSTVASAGACF